MKGRIGVKRARCEEPRFRFPSAIESAGTSGDIQKALTGWFATHQRTDLPWRVPGKRDPYGIWVSEVMAQQTQLSTVIPYWSKWMKRFPTAVSLSKASSEDVRAAWSGLGFYRRADMLHKGSQQIAESHDGKVPTTVEGLLGLSGVGPYTAHAIASICYDEPRICVDGNVIRVLTRLGGLPDVDPKDAKTIKDLTDLANRSSAGTGVPDLLTACARPGDFNEGIMELGASLCAANTTPNCAKCPLSQWCTAYKMKKDGTIADIEGCYPLRGKKLMKRVEAHHALVVLVGKGHDDPKASVLCTVNPEGKLLSQMLAVPSAAVEEGVPSPTFAETVPCGSYKHVFSHITMTVHVHCVLVKPGLQAAKAALKATEASSGMVFPKDQLQLVPRSSFVDDSCTQFAVTSLARKAVVLALKKLSKASK